MMAHEHIKEETLVDYTLGNLTPAHEKQITDHLQNCGRCRMEWENWQHLLASETETTRVPSSGLKERITEDIDQKPIKRNRKLWQKPAFAAACVAAFFVLCFGIYQITRDEPISNNQQQGFIIAQHDLIPEQTFMKKPDTNRLDVIPVTNNEEVHGNVWLNEVTNEMVLKVDGLNPLNTKAYQLWLVKENDEWNGELLKLQNGTVRVYYKGPDIKLLKYIKVSVEPPGGSLTPTGPETLYMNLKD